MWSDLCWNLQLLTEFYKDNWNWPKNLGRNDFAKQNKNSCFFFFGGFNDGYLDAFLSYIDNIN
jgi:hypothetical protein